MNVGTETRDHSTRTSCKMSSMRNLTVSLPEGVLDRLRVLAAEKKLSVNRFVREVLSDVTAEPNQNWEAEHDALLKEIGSRTREGTWNREEVYAERLR